MARIAQLEKPGSETGLEWTYTNGTGSTIQEGTPIVVEEAGSNLKGTALILFEETINTADGTAYTGGLWRVDKTAAGVAIAQGQSVYYDVSESVATNAATATTDGDFVLGTASLAATQASDYVIVDLNKGADAYTVVS